MEKPSGTVEKASKAAAKRENRGKGLKKAARPPRAAGKAHPAPAAGRKQLEHLRFWKDFEGTGHKQVSNG